MTSGDMAESCPVLAVLQISQLAINDLLLLHRVVLLAPIRWRTPVTPSDPSTSWKHDALNQHDFMVVCDMPSGDEAGRKHASENESVMCHDIP